MIARRDFLTLAAGAVAAKTVLPTATVNEVRTDAHLALPDAALLLACTAFLAHAAACPVAKGAAREFGTPECAQHEAAVAAHIDCGYELAEPILEIGATTLEGLLAKSRVLAAWDGRNWIRPNGELSSRMLHDMLANLEGIASRAGVQA